MPAPRVFSGLLADFTPPGPISLAELRCRGDLPHLYRENGSYFVTFRLWDAVESRGAGVSPADRPMGVSPAVPAAAGLPACRQNCTPRFKTFAKGRRDACTTQEAYRENVRRPRSPRWRSLR